MSHVADIFAAVAVPSPVTALGALQEEQLLKWRRDPAQHLICFTAAENAPALPLASDLIW
jgi:hypothetical protein